MTATPEVATALLADRSATALAASVRDLTDLHRDPQNQWEVRGDLLMVHGFAGAWAEVARSAPAQAAFPTSLRHIARTASPVVVLAVSELLRAIAEDIDLAPAVERVARALGVQP